LFLKERLADLKAFLVAFMGYQGIVLVERVENQELELVIVGRNELPIECIVDLHFGVLGRDIDV
jgi:hypothetical protein